jgi:glutaryl-CoA dehydrogenase
MSTATTTDSADFYALESLLDGDEQDFLHRVREFMKSEVEPGINQHWQRGSFPFEIVPGFRQLGLAGLPYQGFGCPGRSFLLDGMVAMELARTDPSIATFAGVHGGCRWAPSICAATTSRSSDICRTWLDSTRSERSV